MRGQNRSRRCFLPASILSRRFGVIIFLTMLLWTYTLFTFALYRTEPDVPESEKLKEQIVELSKRYVKALAAEQEVGKNLPESYTSYDLKKTMAVLLDSILERLGKLEKKVDKAIVNGTQGLIRNSTSTQDALNELISDDTNCIPSDAELEGFSSCKPKVAWMREMWKSDPCYKEYGVDGSECSIRIYLSEVENWCPRLKGREKVPAKETLSTADAATVRFEKDGLFAILTDPVKFRWIKMRIGRMWDSLWVPAAHAFANNVGNRTREKKKILIHIGALTKESGFKIADNAFNGGPLGELVQWSDILSTLYILGHDLEISTATTTLSSTLRRKGINSKASCPVKGKQLYDLIYIDIVGMKQLKKSIGGQWQQFRCILRVIDSFGTEPAYNVDMYIKKAGTKSSWGNWNLVPRQFFTMFPHTPDNSFMGFVVDHENDNTTNIVSKPPPRANKALVYGKRSYFWNEPWIRDYLDKIHEKFEIHATVFLNESSPGERRVIPNYVINHGIVTGSEIQRLLKETKLFIGLGFPYEGPAPLEAVANGCAFLNPKFTPPKSAKNTKFFHGKPTGRSLTSQHPYTEVYIGQPHVWTVDVQSTELDNALNTIAESESLAPYLPFEFTCHGMLERVSVYTQKQEFCTGEKQWPPFSSMQVKVSDIGQSCKDRCMQDDLICEPGFFKHLNNARSIENATLARCTSEVSVEEIYPPALEVNMLSTKCYTQAHHLLYSCAGSGINHKRICPCRDYIRGQVALCRDCRE